ncbi:MAG: S8 family serine peptidase [Patescibacteria group bacterium]
MLFSAPAVAEAADFDVAGIKIENLADRPPVIPNDPLYSSQWYLPKIGAPDAWKIKTASPKVIVAVLDTGVDIDHPDLRRNIWINEREIADNKIDDDRNGFIDDVNGWDFVNNAADPRPKFQPGFIDSEINHGTIVAGIIAAEGNNNFGISGITWRAQIMPLKVLDDKGEGTINNVIRAIDYAVNNGAGIINLSFVTFQDVPELREAIERAHRANIILVATAGNEGQHNVSHSLNDEKLYPVCYDGGSNMVIGVAATDTLDQKTLFSNYGSACVDIAAPGVSFIGLTVYNPYQRYQGNPFTNYYQGYWDGSSMATPVISGSLALLKSINPKLSREKLIDKLLTNTFNISRLNPDYVGQLGWGRLDLAAAALAVYNDFINNRNYIITSSPLAALANVKIFDNYYNILTEFKAYGENAAAGISVTTGDVDRDGRDEIIVGLSPGNVPQVFIFDRTGKLKSKFLVNQKNWRGKINVAAGDVDGDGQIEIIVGAGRMSEPQVKVFDVNGKMRSQFLAYPRGFRGGVNVTIGDLNKDGVMEIITGAGPGGGPQVRIFDRAGRVRGQFFAYDQRFRGGVNVAAGDINQDGSDEIITGAGPGGGPQVRVFNSNGGLIDQFFSYEASFRGGVEVNVLNVKQLN